MIFAHLSYLALYENTSNNYNHWCNEVANWIFEISECRISKNKPKKPNNKDILKYLLSDLSLFSNKYKWFYSKIISDEENPINKGYANKEFLSEFVVNSLTELLNTSNMLPDPTDIKSVATNLLDKNN